MTHPVRPIVFMSLLALLIAGSGCDRARSPERTTRASRGAFSLTVTLAHAEIPFGDSVVLERRFVAPAGTVARFAPLTAAEAEISILEELNAVPAGEGTHEWRERLQVTPLVSGTLSISASEVTYTADATDAAPATLRSKPLELTVRSALTEADAVTQPRNITGVLPLQEPSPVWRGIVGGLIAGAIAGPLAVLLLWFWKRSRRAAQPQPHDIALAELNVLRDAAPTKLPAETFAAVVDVIRGYCEQAFDLRALEMTTEEFLDALRTSSHPALRATRHQLQEFLVICDEVKYAGSAPAPPLVDGLISRAVAFVTESAAVDPQAVAPAIQDDPA